MYIVLLILCINLDQELSAKLKRYMHDAYIQDGFLYGLVEKKNDLEKILELHSFATLSDYIKR